MASLPNPPDFPEHTRIFSIHSTKYFQAQDELQKRGDALGLHLRRQEMQSSFAPSSKRFVHVLSQFKHRTGKGHLEARRENSSRPGLRYF